MNAAMDAQSLISMSLMKIHKSRTQRGGIRLHRNLLVSCVLRNARQVYVKEKHAEIVRMQQYEEVLAVCGGIQQLDPLDAEDDGDEGAAVSGGRAASCAPLEDGGRDPDPEPEPREYRSCCMEAPPAAHGDRPPPAAAAAHCSTTTVLDLDTHVVTTVESGYLHQDCCGDALRLPARKRKVDFGCGASDADDECKRAKREDGPCSSPDHISNLISIFGSGFSGLLSRQADLEQVCSKQALAGLGAWTRAIVAF